jgi:hypothetical protein
MRRGFPSRRFKPHRPGVPTARRWATVMVLPAPVTGQPAMIGARSGGKALAAKAGGPERRVHQGRCGADLKTPRAGRLGTWRTCGLTDFSMPRCCEASRSVGPQGPNASRAPSVLIRERRTWTADCGSPGADQRIRAMTHVRAAGAAAIDKSCGQPPPDAPKPFMDQGFRVASKPRFWLYPPRFRSG